MYLITVTKPDIAYAAGKVARFCQASRAKYWVAVKRVMKYIKSTQDIGLCFERSKDLKPFGYSDSDWAADVEDRKSTGGYVFMMAGAPVSWRFKKQRVVAASSCEAEYISLSHTSRDTIWMRRLMSPVLSERSEFPGPLKVLDDTQSAMKLSRNESINNRNKRIEMSDHFTRIALERQLLSLRYTPTENMVADMMTKSLGTVKLEKLQDLCGLQIKGDHFGK